MASNINADVDPEFPWKVDWGLLLGVRAMILVIRWTYTQSMVWTAKVTADLVGEHREL